MKKVVDRFLKVVDNSLLTTKVYSNDVQFSFSTLVRSYYISKPERMKIASKRSKIVCFSRKSANRLKFLIRNSESLWVAFVTLTYPDVYPADGRIVKVHLDTFLKFLRRLGINYVWVLEFQERGAPHFHVLLSKRVDKNKLSTVWYRIVGSGDIKHLKAGTQIKALRSKKQLYAYLSNYVKKNLQKTVPHGFAEVGRFWGATRNLLDCKVFKKVAHYFDLARATRLFRRWYRAHLRNFGIKFRWNGIGFTMLDGTRFLNYLALRFS